MVPLNSGNPESRSWIKPNFTSRAFSPLRGSSTLGETAGGFTSRSGPFDQDAADLLENYNGEDDKKCFAMTALLYSVLISLSSLEVSWEEDRLAGRKIQWQQQPQVWTCSLFFTNININVNTNIDQHQQYQVFGGFISNCFKYKAVDHAFFKIWFWNLEGNPLYPSLVSSLRTAGPLTAEVRGAGLRGVLARCTLITTVTLHLYRSWLGAPS